MPQTIPSVTKLDRLRRLSQLLDNAIGIPGTKYRIGLDPILGLLPGGGDTVTGALGAYIVVEAARMGLPKAVLWQMVGNILLDSVAGSVPVVGDLFDIGWKANVKNIALLESHLHLTSLNQKSDRIFLVGLILVLAIIVIGFAALTVFVIHWLWGVLVN
ncbi:hypothetical protein Sta7437_3968 [Stanieria cyanosphaera PCC 7437]|uniref:DUF4112 domain-containing protein n=1 Tax=Stanieria cyanosphaera (strain ATCC 29371 / PCC 7437) TaxID=111780 RepID=K9XXX2_STAC7|nr:DUF4112 domain-containing protein [Stanieria cyanosphaera]AFZ37450.1 hypothetical protein Sta7437_3968 [Stanieria cyanosphaera PCC 7437]